VLVSYVSIHTTEEPMYVHDPNARPGAPLAHLVHLGPAPRRSSIPRVIGILAIVFAGLGILGSLAITLGVDEDMRKYGGTREAFGEFGTWTAVYLWLAAVLFAVHLTAGIQSVRYAASAPLWMTIYGALAIALVVLDIAVSVATFPHLASQQIWEDLVYPRIGLAVLALPWPIVALVMMNQRSARLACAARRI
jgi:hypothetical protein